MVISITLAEVSQPPMERQMIHLAGNW